MMQVSILLEGPLVIVEVPTLGLGLMFITFFFPLGEKAEFN